jgi:hypothetical protein
MTLFREARASAFHPNDGRPGSSGADLGPDSFA